MVGGRWPTRRFGPVDIEIQPWSPTMTEVRVARPQPLPSYWGARRVRRYWALAHDAVDRVTEIAVRGPAEPGSRGGPGARVRPGDPSAS